MTKLVRMEFREFGPYKVVGKVLRSGGGAGPNNPIPAFWSACLADGTLTTLERMIEHVPPEVANLEVGYETGWLGGGTDFDYVVGKLMATDCPVPEGFRSYDMPRHMVAMAYLEGEEPAIYQDEERLTREAMREHGYEFHGTYAMEVYVDHNSSFRYYMPCRMRA